jgi:MtrB/PioB family decaheme-associated outer membrane protein
MGALTPYVQNGNALTLVPLPAGLPATITAAKNSAANLWPYDHLTDIGINRDTASFQYRWTPTDAWDIKADYSHLDRTGTQPYAAYGNVVNNIQVARPIDDTTQNYGLNGEYVGTSPWGQRLVFKSGYKGSIYTDNYTDFTVQSPGNLALFAAMPTPPDNQASAFNATLAADLPWKSRYAGTLSYTMMTQNAAFVPFSDQATYAHMPASSLDGDINTLLSNNVVTTKITPELSSKLSYRYYDFKNNTPELFFQNVITAGGDSATLPTSGSTYAISMGYVKQNAGEELNWRPNKEWNLGAAYGFERYDWTRADVDVTNENSGKLYADWKPMSWLTVRSSGYYGDRRYDNYNYAEYVGNFQWMGSGDEYQNTYRQLMIDNRQTWKANVAVDIVVLKNVTVTPTFKYQDLIYGVDPTSQQGLADSRSWSGGVDVTYVVNVDTSVMVGYMYEYATQLLYGSTSTATVIPAGTPATVTNDTTIVNTFTGLVRYAAIPNKLDTELRYTASLGSDNLNLFPVAAPTASSPGGQFPENTTWFQRLDATATYTFDKETVAQLGFIGDLKAKLHYVWTRNTESNWANDPLAPYTATMGTSIAADPWLAWYNPNYNVQMLSASLVASW